MAEYFGSLVFTPVVKTLQERYGSRRQYAHIEGSDSAPARLRAQEAQYLSERDTFYMATVGATGWPYIQHRGGPKGFLKVIDETTIAFADFRGNKQFISTGNLMTDDRVAIILVDYPRQLRLKILGRAAIYEGEQAASWLDRLADPAYKATVERVFVIRVEAFDWNCQQHIVRRYTQEEIRKALEPAEMQRLELEQENERLRDELSRLHRENAARDNPEGPHSTGVTLAP